MSYRKWIMLSFFILSNCTIFSNFLSASNRTADSLALVEFYHAFDGPVWRNSWALDQPISTWHGVALNNQGRVSEIRLSQNRLFSRDVSQDLPSFHLSELEVLDLSINNINTKLPDWNLPNLTTLILRGCDFTELAGFTGSPQLSVLNISSNILSFRDLLPILDLNLTQFTYNDQRYAPFIFFNIGGICRGPVAAQADQALSAFLYFAEENEVAGMRYQWRYNEIMEIGGPTLSLPNAVAGIYECLLTHPDLPALQILANRREVAIEEEADYVDISPQLLSATTTEKCWEIRVQNFENILSLQYGITWDPTVLTFSGIKEVNLEDFESSYSINTSKGQFIIAWLTFNRFDTGVTLEDNSSIFTLCFTTTEEEAISNSAIQLGGNAEILSEIYDSKGTCRDLSISQNSMEVEEQEEEPIEPTEEITNQEEDEENEVEEEPIEPTEEITNQEEDEENEMEEEITENTDSIPTIETAEEDTNTNNPNAEIFEDYSWLSSLVAPNNCQEESVTVYDNGAYQFLLVVTENSEILYFQDGTLYCTNTATYDCVAAYQLTDATQYTWSCGAKEETPTEPITEEPVVDMPSETPSIFEDYLWLASLVDVNNCEGQSIREYNGFVFIDTGDSGQLYRNDGVFYCTSSPTYDCEMLYNLNNIESVWTCEIDGNLQSPTMKFNEKLISSKNAELIIFPNPNNGLFFIAGIDDSDSSIIVYNSTGQIVKQSSIGNDVMFQIDLQSFESGVYYIQINGQQKNKVQKIVIR